MHIVIECKRNAFKKDAYMAMLNTHYQWLLEMLKGIEGNLILRPLYYDKDYYSGAVHGRTIYWREVFTVCINLRIACAASDRGLDTIAHEAAHVATRALHGKMLHDETFIKYYRQFLGRYLVEPSHSSAQST